MDVLFSSQTRVNIESQKEEFHFVQIQMKPLEQNRIFLCQSFQQQTSKKHRLPLVIEFSFAGHNIDYIE